MKRIFTILCALAIVMAGSATALAADAETGQSASYYPISVEEYTYGDFDELRINKTYQLSLSDDPSLIPTEDFTRNGRRYYLLDMTRKDEVGVDIQTHTEAVTQASDTNNLETILQRLDAEMEVTTEDGYVGILRLDHTSVQVTTDGYATKTSTLTASRSYPNLSEADVSLIPKSIEDKGKTLTLGDVKWSESMDVGRRGQPRHPVHRHRQLYRDRQQPVRYRLHRQRQLHRRGVQGQLCRGHLHRHLRQRKGPGGVQSPWRQRAA